MAAPGLEMVDVCPCTLLGHACEHPEGQCRLLYTVTSVPYLEGRQSRYKYGIHE